MILAILQARMSSTRLPGKVLRPLLGRPMLGRQLDRLARSARIDRLVVATSDEAGDDPIWAFCAAEHIGCYRGPLADVLGRYVGAADAFGPAAHIVRLTADCPLTDPTVIDAVIARHLETGADYTSNVHERTFPDGLDVEIMTAATLARAGCEAHEASEREHVTQYIYRHPEIFRLAAVRQDHDLQALRWTVDRPDDFAFAEAVFAALLPVNAAFGQADVLALLDAHPEIARINAGA